MKDVYQPMSIRYVKIGILAYINQSICHTTYLITNNKTWMIFAEIHIRLKYSPKNVTKSIPHICIGAKI